METDERSRRSFPLNMLNTSQSLRQERYRVTQSLAGDESEGLYLAFDNDTESDVTIREFRVAAGKVLATGQLSAARSRFDDAARVVAALRHEALIPVVDYFSEVEGHYLVSEKADGSSIGDFLAKKKSPFPVGDAARWTDRLLDALIYLHGQPQPLFHFAISPAKIKLTPRGQVMLHAADLVRLNERDDDQTAIVYQPLEQIWVNLDGASKKVILAAYDEQSEKLLEEAPDAQSDVYSLGATFYQLLTAKLPADALTRSIELLEGKADPLPPPHELNPSVPPEVSEVVMRALAIRREDRYGSAAIVKQFLRGAFTRYRERQQSGSQPVAPVARVAQPVAPAVVPAAVMVAAPEPMVELRDEIVYQAEVVEDSPSDVIEVAETAVLADEPVVEAIADEAPSFEAPVIEIEVEEVQPTRPPAAMTPDELTAAQFEGDQFSTLFAAPPPSGSVFKKVAVAFAAVALIGGGVFGVNLLRNANTAEAMPVAQQNIAAPVAEPTPAATPEPIAASTPTAPAVNEEEFPAPVPTPAKDPAQSIPAATAVKEKPAENTSARPKNAAVPQSAEVKKPTPAAAKTAPKKKVTLDDLLTDN